MPITDYLNASNFTSNPANTIFSPFVDLLGTGFYLIPISVIGAVIFRKNQDPVIVGIYFLITGALFSTSNIFAGNSEMAFVYIIIVALSITSIISGLLLGRK